MVAEMSPVERRDRFLAVGSVVAVLLAVPPMLVATVISVTVAACVAVGAFGTDPPRWWCVVVGALVILSGAVRFTLIAI
jgi:hypothetical protein